jgi:hypothetical protein
MISTTQKIFEGALLTIVLYCAGSLAIWLAAKWLEWRRDKQIRGDE